MVVGVEVIMHAPFKRINTAGYCKMEILSLQRVEEALDRRVVKAVAFAADTLNDTVLYKQGEPPRV